MKIKLKQLRAVVAALCERRTVVAVCPSPISLPTVCHRRTFIQTICKWAALFVLPAVVPAQFATFFDPPYLAGRAPGVPDPSALDEFESYTNGVELDALAGGSNWSGAFVSHFTITEAFDDFELYAGGADLNGLNLGSNWSAAFVSRDGPPAPLDDFESYSAGTDLNGLNGSSGWATAFVSR